MSIENTLEERGARYGKFIDHAGYAQSIQDICRSSPNWDAMRQDVRQCLIVISDKLARILNGDSEYEDNWHDLQGYARLVEKRIQDEKELFERVAEWVDDR